MDSLLLCSEEMMEDSPDLDSELAARALNKRMLSEQLDFSRVAPRLAFTDPAIADDPRALANLLKLEDKHGVPNYFKMVQDDITPTMRNSITLWMFEVCEEEHMEDSVFLRAAAYMDKFLAVVKINRTQFQLLGAVCLLISSKISGTTITPQRLSYFTANSVAPELLLDWEMMILGVMKWDIYGPVPSDFVQHILYRIPNRSWWDNEAVSDRIKTLTAYCATDHNFGIHPPSTIASACVAAALSPNIGAKEMEEVLQIINLAIEIDMDLLRNCVDQVKVKVQVAVEENSRSPGINCPGLPSNSGNMQNSSRDRDSMMQTEEKEMELSQAGTPTDVTDIHF